MTVLSMSRRREGGRLVVAARGTLTTMQVAHLLPARDLPPEIERVDILLEGVHFEVGALAALARLAAEARLPVHIAPDDARQAVEAAAGRAFARELARATTGGRPVGLCVVDARGRIRFTNGEARALLDLSPQDTGAAWQRVRPAGRDPVAEALARGALAHVRRPDGAVVEAVPLAAGGAVVAFLPAEGATRAAEEQRDALVQMAAAAAHEIRNPLAAIRAAIQLLQGKLADTPHAGTLEVVLSEIDRLARLLDHYLALSRPGVRREVTLTPLVDSCLALVRQDPRSDEITVHSRLPQPGPRVLGEPEKLRQVLWNLLSNALDALDGHGEMSVAIVPDPVREEVSVHICDAGPGFPAEVLVAPFEIFRTTKPGGTGLGLVICQEIVTGHGGRLQLSNRASGGAEVVVTLPTLPEP